MPEDTYKPIINIVCDCAFIDKEGTLHCFFRQGVLDNRFRYATIKIHGKTRVLKLLFVPSETMRTIAQRQALARACSKWYSMQLEIRRK